MKRHRTHLPSKSRSLCQTCGTNVDVDGVDFSSNQGNLVYMDKVFSFNEDTSCPLLYCLNTGGENSGNYTAKLTLTDPGCNVVPCRLSRNAVFNIEKSYVAVDYFNTRAPGNISSGQVTLDGECVDSVSYSNGQYTAKTACVLPDILRQKCIDNNLPSKVFFLICNAGPWDFRARYVLEGTVNSDGRNCCFRAEIYNKQNTCNTSLPPGCLSSFAIPNLSLPCSVDGIAPDIMFQFNANINLVNPQICLGGITNSCNSCNSCNPCCDPCCNPCATPCCAPAPCTCSQCCPPPCNPCNPCNTCNSCNPCNTCGSSACPDSYSISLKATLAIEPTVHVETIRKTLFCVNACEALLPCQGSLVESLAEEEEDCDLNAPDCYCGGSVGGSNSGGGNCSGGCNQGCNQGCNNNWQNYGRECGGFNVGGISVGLGDCSDCLDSGMNNKYYRDRVLGDSDCNDDVLLVGTCGTTCAAPVVAPAKERRTAYQYNGCNGCTW